MVVYVFFKQANILSNLVLAQASQYNVFYPAKPKAFNVNRTVSFSFLIFLIFERLSCRIAEKKKIMYP